MKKIDAAEILEYGLDLTTNKNIFDYLHLIVSNKIPTRKKFHIEVSRRKREAEVGGCKLSWDYKFNEEQYEKQSSLLENIDHTGTCLCKLIVAWIRMKP